MPASYPRFSRDGTQIAWTSWRDGNPEVYTADTDGSAATRLTYWGDPRTRVTGWTTDGEVLAITAAGQPSTQHTHGVRVPLGAPPRRLPFGPVNDLALEAEGDRPAHRAASATRALEALPRRHRGPAVGRDRATTRCSPGSSPTSTASSPAR